MASTTTDNGEGLRGILIIGGILVLAAVVWNVIDPYEPEPTTKTPVAVLTKENYLVLCEGLTYQTVCKVVGFRGEEIKRKMIGNTEIVTFLWTDRSGGRMNVVFHDNMLTWKTSEGLR